MFSGETVDSCEPPNTICMYREIGEICSEGSCSSCNIVRQQNSGAVHGTILVSERKSRLICYCFTTLQNYQNI